MSKKSICALSGVSNKGKSQTIKFVRELILSNYKDCETIYGSVRNSSKDIMLIIKVGSTKIGIESQGDPNSRLFKSIPFFVEQGCNIIVCATRTRGATVDLVNSCKAYGIKWYSPNVVTSGPTDRANTQKAEEIFSNIKKLIN